MPQINAKDLDYSDDMRKFFSHVGVFLVERHNKSPEQAQGLIERFFSLDIDPLERALIMHEDAEQIAADLAGEDA